MVDGSHEHLSESLWDFSVAMQGVQMQHPSSSGSRPRVRLYLRACMQVKAVYFPAVEAWLKAQTGARRVHICGDAIRRKGGLKGGLECGVTGAI